MIPPNGYCWTMAIFSSISSRPRRDRTMTWSGYGGTRRPSISNRSVNWLDFRLSRFSGIFKTSVLIGAVSTLQDRRRLIVARSGSRPYTLVIESVAGSNRRRNHEPFRRFIASPFRSSARHRAELYRHRRTCGFADDCPTPPPEPGVNPEYDGRSGRGRVSLATAYVGGTRADRTGISELRGYPDGKPHRAGGIRPAAGGTTAVSCGRGPN